MTKKILDIISIMSLAALVGVALWGESPRQAGHLSIQSKIIAWDVAPAALGYTWLILRYAKVAAERFPSIFGRRGVLFYLLLIFVGYGVVLHLLSIVSGLISSKTAGG